MRLPESFCFSLLLYCFTPFHRRPSPVPHTSRARTYRPVSREPTSHPRSTFHTHNLSGRAIKQPKGRSSASRLVSDSISCRCYLHDIVSWTGLLPHIWVHRPAETITCRDGRDFRHNIASHLDTPLVTLRTYKIDGADSGNREINWKIMVRR